MKYLLSAIVALLLLVSVVYAANTNLIWKGAVAPAQDGPSGNENRLWKGAVEPADDVAGGAGAAAARRRHS